MSLANKLLSMMGKDVSESYVSEARNPEYRGLSLTEYFQKVFKNGLSYVNISLDESDEDDSLVTHSVVGGVPFTFRFSINEGKPVVTVSTSTENGIVEKMITLSKRMLNSDGDLVIEENLEYMPTDKIQMAIGKLSEKANVVYNFVYKGKDGQVKSVSHNVNERLTSKEKMMARKRQEKKEKLGIISMPNDAKTIADIAPNLKQIGVQGVLNSIEAQLRGAVDRADGKMVRNGKQIKLSPESKEMAKFAIKRLTRLKAEVENNKDELLAKYGAEGTKGAKL